jgi:hypothetical protein
LAANNSWELQVSGWLSSGTQVAIAKTNQFELIAADDDCSSRRVSQFIDGGFHAYQKRSQRQAGLHLALALRHPDPDFVIDFPPARLQLDAQESSETFFMQR